jgi:hypothetical protein
MVGQIARHGRRGRWAGHQCPLSRTGVPLAARGRSGPRACHWAAACHGPGWLLAVGWRRRARAVSQRPLHHEEPRLCRAVPAPLTATTSRHRCRNPLSLLAMLQQVAARRTLCNGVGKAPIAQPGVCARPRGVGEWEIAEELARGRVVRSVCGLLVASRTAALSPGQREQGDAGDYAAAGISLLSLLHIIEHKP